MVLSHFFLLYSHFTLQLVPNYLRALPKNVRIQIVYLSSPYFVFPHLILYHTSCRLTLPLPLCSLHFTLQLSSHSLRSFSRPTYSLCDVPSDLSPILPVSPFFSLQSPNYSSFHHSFPFSQFFSFYPFLYATSVLYSSSRSTNFPRDVPPVVPYRLSQILFFPCILRFHNFSRLKFLFTAPRS